MLDQLRNPRFFIILAADATIFAVALVGAYLLRFDFNPGLIFKAQIFQVLPYFILIKLVIFYLFGLYRGMWRYTSIDDLMKIGHVSLLFALVNTIIVHFLLVFANFPISIFFLDGILTFGMSGGLRVGIRFYYAYLNNSKILKSKNFLPISRVKEPKEKAILIAGAGRAGEITIREILGNPWINCRVAGFIDDDRTKWGRSLHGAKVYGSVEMMPKILEQRPIDEVLIAIPSATGAQMKRIVGICKKCDIPFRTLPEIGSIITGKVNIEKFRKVKYEDLLRRTPVNLDTAEISKYLKGKRVLVTGAGGSIGSELCRQMVQFSLDKLILLDASEANLFNMQMEMEQELKFPHYQTILSKVQHRQLMNTIFAEYRPDVVFHAAAYRSEERRVGKECRSRWSPYH